MVVKYIQLLLGRELERWIEARHSQLLHVSLKDIIIIAPFEKKCITTCKHDDKNHSRKWDDTCKTKIIHDFILTIFIHFWMLTIPGGGMAQMLQRHSIYKNVNVSLAFYSLLDTTIDLHE